MRAETPHHSGVVVQESNARVTIELENGDKLVTYYRVIQCLQDAYAVSGMEFTGVEYRANVDSETREYLDTKIRWVVIGGDGK